MDRVATDTASVHVAAWKPLFDEVMPALGGADVAPFDPDHDYRNLDDGAVAKRESGPFWPRAASPRVPVHPRAGPIS